MPVQMHAVVFTLHDSSPYPARTTINTFWIISDAQVNICRVFMTHDKERFVDFNLSSGLFQTDYKIELIFTHRLCS